MYTQFPGGTVKPAGWLRRQLEVQAGGLAGNLDKVWPDIRSSAWIGGDREGWERVPYWLDGFIPLAYLLEDPDLIARADRYIRRILDRQESDGWICPCAPGDRSGYDPWAILLIGKVLALYCDFTGNKEAETGLYRAMRNLHDLLVSGALRLFGWGKFRWFEGLIPLDYLNARYPEPWIIETAGILREQGADYARFTERWKTPLNQWTFETHIVNIAMMLKYEALCTRLLGEPYQDLAERLWRVLEKYNGTAVGTFTGDECLSGTANNQGTELCAVVELMYSCEVLFSITGQRKWAERLEKVAFNALPATFTDDMWAHQYDQMVNQIACREFPGKAIFRTNGSQSHLFGLEPNYGCCTANCGQGWPKLAMNVFLKSDRGVLCALLLPGVLKTKIGGVDISIRSQTEYPFRHNCRFTVETAGSVDFEFRIRLPQWAKDVRVNGESIKNAGYFTVRRRWEGCTVVDLSFTDRPHYLRRPGGLYTVGYGPLVFALPIETEYRKLEYEKDGVRREYPYCDYELLPRSQWRYGFAGDDLTLCPDAGDEYPFSSRKPRLAIRVKLARVKWEFADGYDSVAAPKPASTRALAAPEERLLVPYGCAKLRMTELPKTKP